MFQIWCAFAAFEVLLCFWRFVINLGQYIIFLIFLLEIQSVLTRAKIARELILELSFFFLEFMNLVFQSLNVILFISSRHFKLFKLTKNLLVVHLEIFVLGLDFFMVLQSCSQPFCFIYQIIVCLSCHLKFLLHAFQSKPIVLLLGWSTVRPIVEEEASFSSAFAIA